MYRRLLAEGATLWAEAPARLAKTPTVRTCWGASVVVRTAAVGMYEVASALELAEEALAAMMVAAVSTSCHAAPIPARALVPAPAASAAAATTVSAAAAVATAAGVAVAAASMVDAAVANAAMAAARIAVASAVAPAVFVAAAAHG